MANYPSWFYTYVQPNIIEDEYRYSHYYNDYLEGDTVYVNEDECCVSIVESYTVFLINDRHMIKVMDLGDFNEIFETFTGGWCAPKYRCMLYFMNHRSNELVPDWVFKQTEGLIQHNPGYGTWTLYQEDGEIDLPPSYVFIWNQDPRSDVMFMEVDEFKDIFNFKYY